LIELAKTILSQSIL